MLSHSAARAAPGQAPYTPERSPPILLPFCREAPSCAVPLLRSSPLCPPLCFWLLLVVVLLTLRTMHFDCTDDVSFFVGRGRTRGLLHKLEKSSAARLFALQKLYKFISGRVH